MEWKTRISHTEGGKETIRGVDLLELVRGKTFAEAIFLILRGDLPKSDQTRMLDAMLIAAIDHGIGTASAMAGRIIASTGTGLQNAVAGAILAFGEKHGGATHVAAKFFQENASSKDVPALVKKLREQKAIIPGYGHKILDRDRRSEVLLEIAKDTKIYGAHCRFAENVYEELNKVSSKKLPLNIDGAMAAILSDMGFDFRLTAGFFVIARVPGLVAQIYEEMTEGPGLRRLAEDEPQYTGKKNGD